MMTDRVVNVPISRRGLLGAAGGFALAGTLGRGTARAQQADRLVVYSTTLPTIQKRMTDAFTKKTGIPVQSLRLTTSPLAQRFLAEQKAGQHVCDVVTLGSDPFFRSISEAGLLAEIDSVPGVEKIPATWRPGKHFVTILMAPQSIGYNTRTVTGASVPRTWLDVLRPEFQGHLIMPDPRANETIVGFLDMLHAAFGDDYIRKLGQQKPKLVATVPQGIEQVIAGEGKIIIPTLAMNLVQYDGLGAPITFTPTPSPTNGTYFFSGIATNAPNKKGARLWYEFVLSAEGQEILCKDNGVSPLGKIPHSLDAPESLVERDLAESLKRAGFLYDLLGLSA
jgi:iron(III) transport system substrate-binding protein